MKSSRSILFLKYLGYSLGPLLVMLVMGIGLIYLNHRYSRLNAEEIVRRNLDQVHTQLDLVFSELESFANALSSDRQLINSARRVLRQPRLTYSSVRELRLISASLNSSVFSRPYLSSIYVYVENEYDQKISTDRFYSPLRPDTDPDWYETHRRRLDEGEDIATSWNTVRNIGAVTRSGRPKEVATIYQPLFSHGSLQTEGVVALNADLDFLRELIRSVLVFPEQVVFVGDGEDIELTVSSEEDVTNSLGDLTEDILAAGSDARFVEVSGEPFLLSVRSGIDGDWKYASLVPREVVYRIPDTLRLFSFLFLVAAAATAVSITIWLSKRSFLQIGYLVDIINGLDTSGTAIESALEAHRDRVSEHLSFSVMRDFVEQHLVSVKASERRYRRRTLELLAMQSQISPHFLHNTIESVVWKSCEFTGGRNEVTTTLEELADILHYALSQDGSFRTLGEEIRYVSKYLEIQRRRSSDGFTVRWSVDPELKDAVIVPMVLLPLVENALQHGFSGRAGEDVLEITGAMMSDEEMQLTVRDNGRGMEPAVIATIRHNLTKDTHTNEHIGLFNTHKRVQLTFGERWGLRISSEPLLYTEVCISLPLRYELG